MDPSGTIPESESPHPKFPGHDRPDPRARGFLAAQRLANQCAVAISKEMRPGWTEKQTAKLMDSYLRDHGVKAQFHEPFAWFGERTRFDEIKNYAQFLSGQRTYREEDVVILDCAPIHEGFVGDIGYTFSRVPNEELKACKEFLLELKDKLRGLFESDQTLPQIWKEIDRDLKARGYDNCHAKYPFRALGHRVHKVSGKGPSPTMGFSLRAVWMFVSRGVLPEIVNPWTQAPKNGYWALEPHLGGRGFGAKFEEILVVENGKACWLDPEVPHAKPEWLES